jgi:hypothetical protein
LAFLSQRNLFRVLPRVCKTDFTHTAIAAASFAADVFEIAAMQTTCHSTADQTVDSFDLSQRKQP